VSVLWAFGLRPEVQWKTHLTLMFLGASFEAWIRERWIHAALEGLHSP
jgi:hypothetical protein